MAACGQVLGDWEMGGGDGPGKEGLVNSIAMKASGGDGVPGRRVSGNIGRVCT